MTREKLNKLLEAAEDAGYELISLDASKCTSITLELGLPVLVNTRTGEYVDAETKEPLTVKRHYFRGGSGLGGSEGGLGG